MITLNTYYRDFRNLKEFTYAHRHLLNTARKGSLLVQVFSGICDKAFLESLLAEIKELLPAATIIGATTLGEIMNGEVSNMKTVISISVFDKTTLLPIRETSTNATGLDLGKAIGEKTKSANSHVIIIFSNLQEQEASDMLNGISAVNEKILVAGGCAGNDKEIKNGYVICNEGVSDCCVVGVACAGEHLIASQYWHLCWTPVGKSMTITKADKNRVFTIDGIPAFQLYRKYLGLPDGQSKVLSWIFPLLLNRHGLDIVQAPLSVNDDDSIVLRSSIEEGEKMRFSYGHIGKIIDSVDSLIDAIWSKPVESIFVYSCGWRRAFLQESTEIETKPLQNLAPTVGFFTNGEFFHIADTNQLLTGTMTTLALSETESIESAHHQRQKAIGSTKHSKASGQVDALSLKSSEIIRTLTCLVESTTQELNEKITELEDINNRVQFDSIHDTLTGLYNRCFYEQELSKIDLTTGSVGILIGDLDGLKLMNDTLGHNAGDKMIRAIADMLSHCQTGNRSVFRIGGDEFVVLLTDCTQEQLDQLYTEICERIKLYNTSNQTMCLSLSMGIAFDNVAYGKLTNLVHEADVKMYANKLQKSKAAKEELAQKLIAHWRENTFRSKQDRDTTQKLAQSFAKYLNLSKETALSAMKLAEYHDIGDINIPFSLGKKGETIDAQEKTTIERHAEIGYRLALATTDLIAIADLILKHHEWWNGQGYPLGIKGELIPFECRMMSIVIAYVAMINNRPYRKSLSSSNAISELRERAGTEFDPELVMAFIRMLEDNLSETTDCD